MGETFSRPAEGFRFEFGGTKTNAQPDSLAPNKYPVTVNVRAITDSSLVTRPGQVLEFNGPLGSVATALTDLRAYVNLFTDNLPRILTRDNAPTTNGIWLDNGMQVGTLADNAAASPGAAMIPFRPAESPTPWMYIANGVDYQKFSAPDVTNTVTQRKVGIAEPQETPVALPLPTAAIFANSFNYLDGGTPVPAGTAGSSSGGQRITDTCGVVLPDPGDLFLNSVQVSASVQYQRFMKVEINGATNKFIVQDVFPGFPTPLSVLGIYYFTGTTGRCVVVPDNLFPGPGNVGASLYGPTLIASLRRGALIQIGSEICLVWSVTTGPDGTVAIETSTTGTHTTAEMLTGIPSIQVLTPFVAPGDAITSVLVYNGTVTSGIGTVTIALSSSPFVNGNASFQPDDYIHFSVNVDDLSKLNEIKILWDVGDGSFTQNFYYYAVRPSDIAAAVPNTLTQLALAQTVEQRATIDEEDAAAANNQLQTASSAQTPPGSTQWAEIFVPIASLTRIGNDQTKTLQNVNSAQILINASGSINVLANSFSVSGGFQPDVGDVGLPYTYRIRPRSVLTGVKGNPSPATRYGVSPRRESVVIVLPLTYPDPQVDTLDIFRMGGTITSWRFIGSAPLGQFNFVDNYDDAAAEAGEPLDFDNFEPWPSIDLPLNVTATQVIGTIALVTIPAPTNVLRYLPGNLVQIGLSNAYTLRSRPVLISGTTYQLEFEENAGALTGVMASIYEPALANQPLPYMWGPDAAGTVFAAGDQLRPGTLYFTKGYAPDAAPDDYNIEITPPSEPLMGGATLDGLSFVASTERWWALYPQTGNAAQRYSYIQQPFTRGVAAPYGICDDGRTIYWWAKDGIYSSSAGSLTDADLYDIFPHEGVVGAARTYNGVTVQAPNYSRAGTFRLAYKNGYLYATYQDTSNTYRCLVLDVRRSAWSVDAYTPPVSVFYAPEQQAGTLLTPTARYPELMMASVAPTLITRAAVSAQQVNTNDLGGAIACVVARAEYDGGDVRAPKQWGDGFLDLVPAALTGVSVTPMSLGAGVAAVTVVPSGTARLRTPISVGGIVVSDFLGVFIAWTDNFGNPFIHGSQTVPTRLYVWQPSFVVQPARTIAWTTFGSSFGLDDYFHIRSMEFAYVSTAPITLTITTYDGQSPQVVTLPSTGGQYQKTFFPLTANKGQLYSFAMSSAATFQIFFDDSDFHVGAWGRTTPYAQVKNFGGSAKDAAPI